MKVWVYKYDQDEEDITTLLVEDSMEEAIMVISVYLVEPGLDDHTCVHMVDLENHNTVWHAGPHPGKCGTILDVRKS